MSYMSPFFEKSSGSLVYMQASTIPARHAFSTRYGGVSEGDFASLNLGFGRGDPDANVLENYRRFGAAVGVDVNRAAFTKQVHGSLVRVVTREDAVSPDAPGGADCDGLVTAQRGLALFCFTADCVPVLLCDAERHVAAAVHCGWRSSVADILGEAVGKMVSLGARPEAICAALGPAIGAGAFETDGDVPDALRAWLGRGAEEFIYTGARAGKFNVDLRGANAHRLMSLGLRRENIAVSTECTVVCHEKYWSHRYCARHKLRRGSQCAVIQL